VKPIDPELKRLRELERLVREAFKMTRADVEERNRRASLWPKARAEAWPHLTNRRVQRILHSLKGLEDGKPMP